MKHLIQHSPKGRTLLLLSLIAALPGAAQAQAPRAGTASVKIDSPQPGDTYPVNTMVTMGSIPKATAGGVDAVATLTNQFIFGQNIVFYSISRQNVPKNTTPLLGGLLLDGYLTSSGSWQAGAIIELSAPGTTTVSSIAGNGFTVTP